MGTVTLKYTTQGQKTNFKYASLCEPTLSLNIKCLKILYLVSLMLCNLVMHAKENQEDKMINSQEFGVGIAMEYCL